MTPEEARATIRDDRFAAHSLLFPHRHEYPFAPFHRQLIEDFWSEGERFIDFGFRECGKTTLVEEALVVAACEGSFRNCLIVGAKEELAAELLTNVKVELETNDAIWHLYGPMRGSTWTTTKITLAHTEYCIQAIGRDQSLRGTKHRDWRPDLIVINDFENDDDILTPEGRRRALRWVLKVLRPACDRARRKFRIYDTVRDRESVPMMLAKLDKWPHRFIPISYLDEEGEERSSWPQHPTLTMEWINAERASYAAFGELDIWEREFMMTAETQADRIFTSDDIKIEPQIRAWQAVYAMIDPARTVGRRSATTGWAVWSWVRNRLIVWEAGARHLLPDEIIDLAFRINADYAPVEVGIEKDGLNEWLAQPVRQEQLRRRMVIPFRAVPAPTGKIDFIRGLQPFFASGEIVFHCELPELRDQLLGFPTGRIDAPNALAYALLLRPGRLIYENWNPNAHIIPAEPIWGRGLYLAANTERAAVTAQLIQLVDGCTVVLADWVQEGDPGEALSGILREASMMSGGARIVLHAGQRHWEQYRNTGLVQAARSLGIETRRAGDLMKGRELIRKDLSRIMGDRPSFQVCPEAAWTLRAFAGGYSRGVDRGRIDADPEANNYRTLMEGLESLCGLFAFGMEDEDEARDNAPNWAYTADGRRYLSAVPSRQNLSERVRN